MSNPNNTKLTTIDISITRNVELYKSFPKYHFVFFSSTKTSFKNLNTLISIVLIIDDNKYLLLYQ